LAGVAYSFLNFVGFGVVEITVIAAMETGFFVAAGNVAGDSPFTNGTDYLQLHFAPPFLYQADPTGNSCIPS